MRLHKLLIAIALCLCLSVVVSAHPGSTHSDGGHFNRSTGEYHYHHGYPAHEHSDMDGDGNLDCPYLFDDKTESSKDDTEPPVIKNESKKETANKRTVSDYVDIICWLFFAFWLLLGLLQWAFDEIKKRFKK
jgi:hypothetical protein